MERVGTHSLLEHYVDTLSSLFFLASSYLLLQHVLLFTQPCPSFLFLIQKAQISFTARSIFKERSFPSGIHHWVDSYPNQQLIDPYTAVRRHKRSFSQALIRPHYSPFSTKAHTPLTNKSVWRNSEHFAEIFHSLSLRRSKTAHPQNETNEQQCPPFPLMHLGNARHE